MTLKLDPGIPLVWRSPDTLQIGAARPLLVLPSVSPVDEHLLAALRAGVPRSTLDVIARTAGGGPSDVDRLLGALRSVLSDSNAEPVDRVRRVHVDGDGETVARLVGLLGEVGIEATADAASADAVVLVAEHVVEPHRYGPLLRRDLPHLPIVFTEAGVGVGPLVVPGEGPCLYCLELARSDADTAWAAIAAQLARRRAPQPPLLAIAAATAALELVVGHFAGSSADVGRSVVIDATTAARRRLTHRPHPECGCRSLPGSATAAGTHAAAHPPATSSAAASVVPA